MNQAEKIHNAIKEMDRKNISILGISEMKWPDSGNINIENHKVRFTQFQQLIHISMESILFW